MYNLKTLSHLPSKSQATEPLLRVMLGRACKALCRQEEDCSFWTYREGFNRDLNAKDCFLKEGTPGRSLAEVYTVPKAPFSHHIS